MQLRCEHNLPNANTTYYLLVFELANPLHVETLSRLV